jgi:hypothetical protein
LKFIRFDNNISVRGEVEGVNEIVSPEQKETIAINGVKKQ